MGPPTSVGGSDPQGGGLVFSMFMFIISMFMFYDHVVITLCMLFACIYIYALRYKCY